MKKLIRYCAFLLAALILAGCAHRGAISVDPATTEDYSESSAPAETGEGKSGHSVDGEAPTESIPATTCDPFPEGIIFDDLGVRIKVVSTDLSLASGFRMFLEISNSLGRNITVHCEHFVVNGISVSGKLSAKVNSGKTQTATLNIVPDMLTKCVIEQIGTVMAYEGEILDKLTSEKVGTLEFSYIDKDIAGTFEQSVESQGRTYIKSDDFKVVFTKLVDTSYGKALQFYIQNDADFIVLVEADHIYVNGVRNYKTLMQEVVYPGTCGYGWIDLGDWDLVEMGLANVELTELSFELEVMVYETDEKLIDTDLFMLQLA